MGQTTTTLPLPHNRLPASATIALNRNMRRALAITLFLFFILPLLTPLLAQVGDWTNGSDPDAHLPACCRRSGAHHCSMSAAQLEQLQNGEHLTTVQSRCPLFPHATLVFGHDNLALHTPPSLVTALPTTTTRVQQAQASARIAESGARHKRGPPTARPS